MVIYLSWDVFCSITTKGLPLQIFRELQLGKWLQNWEKGTKLPFGKIIDDLSGYFKIPFSSHFKNFEDMVDSEMITYLLLGSELQKVHCITYPPKNEPSLSERINLALGAIRNIETVLERKLPKNTGKLYVLDESDNRILKILEPSFLIFL